MAFGWIELYHLAKDLHEGKLPHNPKISHECYLRTVCSRAYYATFCLTRDFEKGHGAFNLFYKNFTSNPKNPKSVHIALTRYLRQKSPDLARNLEDLRKIRNKCDYETPHNIRNFEEETKKALDTAKKIISKHCGQTI